MVVVKGKFKAYFVAKKNVMFKRAKFKLTSKQDEQLLLERKPGELLKLISRLDTLDSDDYKGKVEDKYPKLVEGSGVMKASYCIALKKDSLSKIRKQKKEMSQAPPRVENRGLSRGRVQRVRTPFPLR